MGRTCIGSGTSRAVCTNEVEEALVPGCMLPRRDICRHCVYLSVLQENLWDNAGTHASWCKSVTSQGISCMFFKFIHSVCSMIFRKGYQKINYSRTNASLERTTIVGIAAGRWPQHYFY
eukprot:m.128779 g.128779  ORF g.128779 m.128779 type:complete len:119 (-) comp17446_c0_seq1:1004-1360(-)